MTTVKRPRVATIGLDSGQVESLEPLCGDCRSAVLLDDYLVRHSWTETDVMVSTGHHEPTVDTSVNLMTIGYSDFRWKDQFGGSGRRRPQFASTDAGNTERELRVPDACPEPYKTLAAELARQLGQAEEPPDVIATSRRDRTALIETTSGLPVALRLALPRRLTDTKGGSSRPIGLLLPEVSNLSAWFRAFLYDVHKSDPDRVPHSPPRLAQLSDWYTPQEQELADRISKIKSDIGRLTAEQAELKTELDAERMRADNGIRRILWANGDDLVAAAQEVLSGLGFNVRNMDLGRSESEPKREDLRLTLPDHSGWEAIVEVKGYTNGTRTNDTRQIREHRDLYIVEESQPPSLTIWLANPFRTLDPSSRPAPDPNVQEAAANIGAVYVPASDLYRQWALVAADRLEADCVVQSLINADPGLWKPRSKVPALS